LPGFFLAGVLGTIGYGLTIFRDRNLLQLRLLRSLRRRRPGARPVAAT
jgi:hypothetical protein